MLKVSEVKLPVKTFGAEVNLSLLAQANYVQTDRAHIGLRNTKTRGEINRTTKKVYKQKGTGGARHGSRRANVFVGGGVVFGPRAGKRVVSLSKSLRNAAKVAAFSARAKEKQVLTVSGTSKVAKTKEVAEFVKKLEGKRFTFVVSDKAKETMRFFRNLKNVEAVFFKDITAKQILTGGIILVDEEVFEKANKEEKKIGAKTEVKLEKKEAVKSVKKVVKKASK
jgi:large subunit ribosomal protein L4